MILQEIYNLAAHLHLPLRFYGVVEPDIEISVYGYRSSAMDTVTEAFELAEKEAFRLGRSHIYYHVEAEIGDDITVTSIDGYFSNTSKE